MATTTKKEAVAAVAYICIGLADGNEPYSSAAACTQYKHTHRHTRAYKLYTRAGENERWRIYIYIYSGACAKGTKNAEVLDTPGVVRCADERERWLGGWCELRVSMGRVERSERSEGFPGILCEWGPKRNES